MNKSESKAYSWLLKQGIPEESIVFQKAPKSPDFLFTDRDIKYEVKRLYGKKILLRRKQFRLLKKMSNVEILVFSDESEEPVAIIPVKNIEEGMERAEGILLCWVPAGLEPVKTGVTVNLSDEDFQALADISRETERSISSLVREAVKKWLKNTK